MYQISKTQTISIKIQTHHPKQLSVTTVSKNDGDTLEEGFEYNFNLNAYEIESGLIVASFNTIAIVKVFDEYEYLIDGSFVIEPSCNDSMVWLYI